MRRSPAGGFAGGCIGLGTGLPDRENIEQQRLPGFGAARRSGCGCLWPHEPAKIAEPQNAFAHRRGRRGDASPPSAGPRQPLAAEHEFFVRHAVLAQHLAPREADRDDPVDLAISRGSSDRRADQPGSRRAVAARPATPVRATMSPIASGSAATTSRAAAAYRVRPACRRCSGAGRACRRKPNDPSASSCPDAADARGMVGEYDLCSAAWAASTSPPKPRRCARANDDAEAEPSQQPAERTRDLPVGCAVGLGKIGAGLVASR